MKVTITLEHWNKAKSEDAAHYGFGRVHYCPIAQCLMSMGFDDVEVGIDKDSDNLYSYVAKYGTKHGVVTDCGVTVAKTFDREEDLPADLLPCTFDLDEVSAS